MGRLVLVSAALLLGATACGTTTARRSVPPPPKFVVYATPNSSPRHTSGHGVGNIWRVHLNGTHAKRIASGNDPVLSPDGRWIAFYRGSHLLVMPAQGGRAKRVFTFRANDLDFRIAPTWAPDSRHVALQSYDGFVVLDIRSRAVPLRIARPPVGWGSVVSEPSFSPDSRKILYTETGFGDAFCSPDFGCSYYSTLSVVSARTGNRFHLALPQADHVERGEFSPDSSKIVFLAGGNLFVLALRGGGKPLRLTRGHTSSDPVWGKTGIAFLRHKDIWMTDETGRQLRRLTHTRAGLRPTLVSASGRELIASSASSSCSLPNGAGVCAIELGAPLWAVDVRSGRARELTPRGHSIAPLGLSSNGKTLLGVGGCSYAGGGEGNVETISLTSGKRRVIARGPCDASWNAG
jgi:Tol biopolymer transport system component